MPFNDQCAHTVASDFCCYFSRVFFVLFFGSADAVREVGRAEQDEADAAFTEAQDMRLFSPRPVTDAEIEDEGEEFVAGNAVCEAETSADPEADPREGMDEATAAIETYGRLMLPTPTPSEIESNFEMFVLENEICEMEAIAAEDADVEATEASEALEQMDAVLALQEIHAEQDLAAAVIRMAEEEQATIYAAVDEWMPSGPLSPSDSEIQAAGEEFELELAIAEAQQAFDPDDAL
eukprot:m.212401 g.212401  ORF g.212401 m.212401 type:complete len:236 (+) comp25528_c0_seq3:157-864(+)